MDNYISRLERENTELKGRVHFYDKAMDALTGFGVGLAPGAIYASLNGDRIPIPFIDVHLPDAPNGPIVYLIGVGPIVGAVLGWRYLNRIINK